MLPALAALDVYGMNKSDLGLPGSISGLLIDEFNPKVSAEETEHEDHLTNNAVTIFSKRRLMFEVKAKKTSRSTDISNAHPGTELSISDFSYLTSGFMQNHSLAATNAILVLTDPVSSPKKAAADDYSFNIKQMLATLPK